MDGFVFPGSLRAKMSAFSEIFDAKMPREGCHLLSHTSATLSCKRFKQVSTFASVGGRIRTKRGDEANIDEANKTYTNKRPAQLETPIIY